MQIIGRKGERSRLEDCCTINKPFFVAVYGRRRVGKTFLIEQHFKDQLAFQATGVARGSMKTQLKAFHRGFARYGEDYARCPASWEEAFGLLEELLDSGDAVREKRGGKLVVFIDEMPWFDTRRSKFFEWLGIFWNEFASKRDDIVLVACGSASSWMLNKLIRDRGALYNRVNIRLPLAPFSLGECESYCRELGLGWSRRQVLEAYMVFGGVPFYYDQLDRRKSLPQNIDDLLLSPTGALHFEYDDLTRTLFDSPESYAKLLEMLAARREGASRQELEKSRQTAGGQSLTRMLGNLVQCGFIREYLKSSGRQRTKHYQVSDPFLWFHFSIMSRGKTRSWTDYVTTQSYASWSGYAFELVCTCHVKQIKRALGIEGVQTEDYPWSTPAASQKKAQIDLVIDRRDGVVNLCEMKYYDDVFVIDEEYGRNLLRKKLAYREETKTRKSLHITMVTMNGVMHDARYLENVTSEVVGEQLFD